MKHLKFLAAVCCMLAVFTACEKNEPNDNGNGINTDQNGGNSNTDNSSGSVSSPTGTENGHGYVDLGLSVKWATCNVGATKPEEYGNYYAWGEIEPKTDYSPDNYKWGTATYDDSHYCWFLETLTKYNTSSEYGTVDNKTVLDLEDDAAAVNWGGAWRMPTEAELKELRENCAWKWTDNYNNAGIAGRIVTSNINGNSIFLPSAGSRYGVDLHLAGGIYWSSSLNSPGDAWNVRFYSDGVFMYGGSMYNYSRYNGWSVRPVLGE